MLPHPKRVLCMDATCWCNTDGSIPKSAAPLVTRWLLISGTILLLAGLAVEFSHLADYRAGVTAFAMILLSFHGCGFGIPGGIDIATIFSSAVFALVNRST